MLKEQNGRCAICGEEFGTGNPYHVDHSHTLEAARSLLCVRCNLGLGSFRDNPYFLVKAAFYIVDWDKKLLVRKMPDDYHATMAIVKSSAAVKLIISDMKKTIREYEDKE